MVTWRDRETTGEDREEETPETDKDKDQDTEMRNERTKGPQEKRDHTV